MSGRWAGSPTHIVSLDIVHTPLRIKLGNRIVVSSARGLAGIDAVHRRSNCQSCSSPWVGREQDWWSGSTALARHPAVPSMRRAAKAGSPDYQSLPGRNLFAKILTISPPLDSDYVTRRSFSAPKIMGVPEE